MTSAADARSMIRTFIGMGLTLIVCGVGLALLLMYALEEAGSTAILIGGVCAGIGQVLLMVGLIAYAVGLGLRSVDLSD